MAPHFVISLCDKLYELPEPHVARRDVYEENLSTASRDHLFGQP
jgi:hypothetical protein